MRNNKQGFSIIESIVAISLVGFFVTIFGVTYTIISTSQFLKHKNLAYYLVLEEIEILRQLPFSQLTNQIDTDFIGVAYNQGSWLVQNHASAPSSPKTYFLNSPTGEISIASIPGFEYTDFTAEIKINIDNSSPSNWEAGLLARYSDAKNFYSIYLDSGNIYLTKTVDGVKSTIDSTVKVFSKSTWYTLKVVMTGNTFDVYINDILQINNTDNEFNKGRLALLGTNSVLANFDNVSITTTSTKTWNFDSDTLGEIATAWQRFGINDLPNGTTNLTIEDDQPGFETLKKVTATIEWMEKNQSKSVELSTLINQ
ncbi:MAG: family 16 glycoside hydrolase [Candidatus Kerfeldbacteria bacterium]